MALIAHWPLNGDLKDYSGRGNDLILNNGTLTWLDTGKIGKVHQGETSTLRCKLNDDLKNTFGDLQENSICFWVRVNQVTQNWPDLYHFSVRRPDGSTATNRIETHKQILVGGSNYHLWWGGPRYSYDPITNYERVDGISSVGFFEKLGEFYHLTITRSGKTLKLFKNGDHIGTTSMEYSHQLPITGDFLLSETTAHADINDFRIYNHALSDKEIKEISKAKILHYTCNDMQEPTVNLYSNGKFDNSSGWLYGSWDSDSFSSEIVDIFGFKTATKAIKITKSGTGRADFHQGRKMTTGKTYTLSAYARGNGKISTHSHWGSDANKYYNLTSDWQIITITNTASDSGYMWFDASDIDTYCELTLAVLEEKNYSTLETIGHIEGTREGIVNDISGHQNHATLELANTPHWVKDSRLGTGGYEFYGSQQIKTKQLFFDDQNQNWTTCGWVCVNDNTVNGQYFNNFNLGNEIIHSSKKALMYLNSGDSDNYMYSNIIPNSRWVHLGFVVNPKTKRKDIYLNGVKHNYSGASWDDTDLLNGFKTETIFGQSFSGKMDDIRVYATDLSDSDMMELYQSKANLDSNGNLVVNCINEQKNIFDKQNQALKDKEFDDGLGHYTQTNCQVSFTNEGYRIYRPSNLEYPEDGNTMWGGMMIYDGDDNYSNFKPGRKYKLTFDYKGQSSNSFQIYFGWDIGWTRPGLKKIVPSSSNSLLTNFESDWQTHWAIFEPDKVFYESTSTDGGVKLGGIYNCMEQMKIGYSYVNTGVLGTDITIRNLKIVDITDDPGTFNDKSLLETNGLNEVGVTDGMIGYWKFNGTKTDFSSADSVDPSFHYDSVLTSDGVKFVNTENSYIIYKKIHEQVMVKGKEDEESYSISLMVKPSGVTQQNEAMVFAKPGNHTGLVVQNNKWNWRFAMTTGVRYVFSSEIISPNEWVHISCTYNRREAKIYVNGVLNNTVTIDGSYNWSADYFKSGYSGANFKFDGKIKEVKVFNRALSDTEVKIEYNRLMTDEKMAIRKDGTVYAKNFKEGY